MKKLFLIPLMTLVCSVMAMATVHEVADYDQLKTAIKNAANGDEIRLTADINYGYQTTNAVNIKKSITLDGQGFTLTGSTMRASNNNMHATLWINLDGADSVSVVFKNIKVVNPYPTNTGRDFVIHTRGKLKSIELDNVELDATGTNSVAQSTCLQIGGNQYNTAKVLINNSKLIAGPSNYAFSTWNCIDLETNDSQYSGYCAMYFHANGNYTGTKLKSVRANNCDFDAPNIHSGESNNFGVFAVYDHNIKIDLHNCGMNANATGNSLQAMLTSNSLSYNPGHILKISGDNSHINGSFVMNFTTRDSIVFSGGTYSVNPATTGKSSICVAEGYEVQEVKQGETPLYRVVKKAATHEDPENPGQQILYNLNDSVAGEGVAKGNNPVSSFNLSTGENMTLNNDTTKAGYVEINNGTTVTVGQTGEGENQTLVINNGLDVQGNSQVIVESGATLQIGEGGINTEHPENIIIEANENGAASVLLDPTITINQTPYLTVKMKAKSIGWLNLAGEKSYFWHRFALPIQQANSWVKNPIVDSYVFGWNYTANEWEQLSALTQMVPFKGYTLTADVEDLGDVEYTFTGQLAGNTNNALQFERNGFNFFGNSYTGYIDILALVDQIMGDNKIDGTVWMWGEGQKYYAVPLQALRERPDDFDDWQKEVAPMQTFILKQNGSENATAELNYASAVWGNPRYGNTPAGAPARRAAADETTRMRIIVTAENGKSDFVMLTEDGKFSDAFEKGYDGEKYMNENALNMYTTVEGTNYGAVATDNLEGKMMTIKTVEAVNYTMSFAKVNGEEYAIRDNATGAVVAIEEGATYEFAAQPNSTVEGRFEILPIAKMPTAIENTEVKANVKGIYTIMGQYLGEDFDVLPAGIYVVNGVKIVK